MEQEAPRRRRRLSAEDKWQIFTEASAKDAKVADVLRRWRIDSSQLARIRTQVKEGALTQLKKGPGRNPKDQEKEALKAEVSRLEDAFKEVSIENTCCEKNPAALDRRHPRDASARGDQARAHRRHHRCQASWLPDGACLRGRDA
jgi:transposase-like protein